MREGKERIIYDNYDIEEQYRDAVLEDLEEGETLKEQDLWDRMYEMSQIEWELTKADLETFFFIRNLDPYRISRKMGWMLCSRHCI